MWRSKDQHSVSGESGVIHFNLFLSLTGILANIPRLTRTHKQNKLFCLFKQCNNCSSYHFAISTDAKMNFTFVRTHLRSTLLWIVVIFRHYWRDFFPSLPWFLGVFISSASILCIKVFVFNDNERLFVLYPFASFLVRIYQVCCCSFGCLVTGSSRFSKIYTHSFTHSLAPLHFEASIWFGPVNSSRSMRHMGMLSIEKLSIHQSETQQLENEQRKWS